jgi:hypothetical protein
MGYVINLPLVGRGVYKIYKLIPLPVEVEKSKFVYTENNQEILYIDQTRQYYFSTGREELRKCKSIEPDSYICKQNQPLLNSHMQELCAVKLLQPRRNIPKSCDTRIVQLEHTVWSQLEKRNEWLYFAPSFDSLTVLCPEKEPLDVILKGTGKVNLKSGCKSYSLTALLNTKSDVHANTSKGGGDLLSKVETQFECCEQFGKSLNLSHITLNMKLKHVINHMNDLKYASYKITELENLAREQEWKRSHYQDQKRYSSLVYIVLAVIGLYGSYKLVRFLITLWRKWKSRRLVSAQVGKQLSLPASGTGNVVNINIQTSNESLAINPETIPLQNMEETSVRDSTPDLRRSKRTKKY